MYTIKIESATILQYAAEVNRNATRDARNQGQACTALTAALQQILRYLMNFKTVTANTTSHPHSHHQYNNGNGDPDLGRTITSVDDGRQGQCNGVEGLAGLQSVNTEQSTGNVLLEPHAKAMRTGLQKNHYQHQDMHHKLEDDRMALKQFQDQNVESTICSAHTVHTPMMLSTHCRQKEHSLGRNSKLCSESVLSMSIMSPTMSDRISSSSCQSYVPGSSLGLDQSYDQSASDAAMIDSQATLSPSLMPDQHQEQLRYGIQQVFVGDDQHGSINKEYHNSAVPLSAHHHTGSVTQVSTPSSAVIEQIQTLTLLYHFERRTPRCNQSEVGFFDVKCVMSEFPNSTAMVGLHQAVRRVVRTDLPLRRCLRLMSAILTYNLGVVNVQSSGEINCTAAQVSDFLVQANRLFASACSQIEQLDTANDASQSSTSLGDDHANQASPSMLQQLILKAACSQCTLLVLSKLLVLSTTHTSYQQLASPQLVANTAKQLKTVIFQLEQVLHDVVIAQQHRSHGHTSQVVGMDENTEAMIIQYSIEALQSFRRTEQQYYTYQSYATNVP